MSLSHFTEPFSCPSKAFLPTNSSISRRRSRWAFRLALEQAWRDFADVGLEPAEDFLRIFGAEGEFSQGFRLAHFQAPDEVFDGRDARRRHAQFIDAQTEEDGREEGVARHFPANPDPDAVFVAGLD